MTMGASAANRDQPPRQYDRRISAASDIIPSATSSTEFVIACDPAASGWACQSPSPRLSRSISSRCVTTPSTGRTSSSRNMGMVRSNSSSSIGRSRSKNNSFNWNCTPATPTSRTARTSRSKSPGRRNDSHSSRTASSGTTRYTRRKSLDPTDHRSNNGTPRAADSTFSHTTRGRGVCRTRSLDGPPTTPRSLLRSSSTRSNSRGRALFARSQSASRLQQVPLTPKEFRRQLSRQFSSDALPLLETEPPIVAAAAAAAASDGPRRESMRDLFLSPGTSTRKLSARASTTDAAAAASTVGQGKATRFFEALASIECPQRRRIMSGRTSLAIFCLAAQVPPQLEGRRTAVTKTQVWQPPSSNKNTSRLHHNHNSNYRRRLENSASQYSESSHHTASTKSLSTSSSSSLSSRSSSSEITLDTPRRQRRYRHSTGVESSHISTLALPTQDLLAKDVPSSLQDKIEAPEDSRSRSTMMMAMLQQQATSATLVPSAIPKKRSDRLLVAHKLLLHG